jgi:hypothetical protein
LEQLLIFDDVAEVCLRGDLLWWDDGRRLLQALQFIGQHSEPPYP